MTRDPFAALGLPARPDLTDDDVRAAWRRLAATTHPDRADGGDPAAFAAAASAYSDLRTRFGRTEALADRRPHRAVSWPWRGGLWSVRLRVWPGRLRLRVWPGRVWPGRVWPGRVWPGRVWRGRVWPGRVWRGRPARLALRVLAAAAVSVLAVLIAGWQPATPALMVGALTWLIRGARRDLAPRR